MFKCESLYCSYLSIFKIKINGLINQSVNMIWTLGTRIFAIAQGITNKNRSLKCKAVKILLSKTILAHPDFSWYFSTPYPFSLIVVCSYLISYPFSWLEMANSFPPAGCNVTVNKRTLKYNITATNYLQWLCWYYYILFTNVCYRRYCSGVKECCNTFHSWDPFWIRVV